MKRLHIHPLTLPLFLVLILFKECHGFFVFYIFIFLHELSHAFCCIILGEKCESIHLLPWGCMLSLSTIPKKGKSILIFLAGPIFNLLMFFLEIYPKENLMLALFNLIPVMPLDGGMLLGIILPQLYFPLSLFCILVLFLLCLYFKLFPLLPLLLLALLLSEKKRKANRLIAHKILHNLRQK